MSIPLLRRMFSLVLAALSSAAGGEPARLEFNRDIRPILSENCFHCHGQDANRREAKLRLDERDNATRERDGRFVIAPIKDLKQRGLLDDTLVIWGGEFGRTPYAQGDANREKYGPVHHGKAFSIWMAGVGIQGGITHGTTDDFGFNVVENPVHAHDLHATILHCLGIDHTRLTFKYQGRQYRLTDVHVEVVKAILT